MTDEPDKTGKPKPWPERWWTVRDVAEYRGVRVGTVYKWVYAAQSLQAEGKEGGIPFSQTGRWGNLRFRPELVRAYFDDMTQDYVNLRPSSLPTDNAVHKVEREARRAADERLAAIEAKLVESDRRMTALMEAQTELTERMNTIARDVATLTHLSIVTNEEIRALVEQVKALVEAQARTDKTKIKAVTEPPNGKKTTAAKKSKKGAK